MTKNKKSISEIFLEIKKKEMVEIGENNKNNKEKIMNDIEMKTEKKIMNELNKGSQKIDVLQSILSDSAAEFKEKMGRNMTYSEMREMYG